MQTVRMEICNESATLNGGSKTDGGWWGSCFRQGGQEGFPEEVVLGRGLKEVTRDKPGGCLSEECSR